VKKDTKFTFFLGDENNLSSIFEHAQTFWVPVVSFTSCLLI